MNFELENRLSWGKNRVDCYDLFIVKVDELFKGIDRELLRLFHYIYISN